MDDVASARTREIRLDARGTREHDRGRLRVTGVSQAEGAVRRIGWNSVLLVAVCGYAHAAPVPKADADVLSACMTATVYKVAAYGVNQRDDVIYVSPNESEGAETAKESAIQGDLHGAHLKKLSALFKALRDRAGKGWRPPKGLSVAGLQVKIEKPPWTGITLSKDGTASFPDKEHVSFWFYPPGYSIDAKSAIAHAWVGPTPHGATVSCELTLRGHRWIVANSWFTPYL